MKSNRHWTDADHRFLQSARIVVPVREDQDHSEASGMMAVLVALVMALYLLYHVGAWIVRIVF